LLWGQPLLAAQHRQPTNFLCPPLILALEHEAECVLMSRVPLVPLPGFFYLVLRSWRPTCGREMTLPTAVVAIECLDAVSPAAIGGTGQAAQQSHWPRGRSSSSKWLVDGVIVSLIVVSLRSCREKSMS
jgi:hypothetical protein